MNDMPPIPAIENDELREAIVTLARSAKVLSETIIVMAVSDKSPKEIIQKHSEVIMLSSQVVEHWCEYLGIDSANN